MAATEILQISKRGLSLHSTLDAYWPVAGLGLFAYGENRYIRRKSAQRAATLHGAMELLLSLKRERHKSGATAVPAIAGTA